MTPMVKFKGKGGRTAPLDEYDLDDGWWQRGDPGGARPFVGGATYRPSDTPVVIKQWQRRSAVDDDVLREIWRDEIRQLNRLKGLPKASSYLATLRDSFEDDQAFSLVLDCGDRVPLAYRVQHAANRSWHASPRTLQSRQRLWQEVRRLADAIGILHGQGLLHRNIDPWAVMTAAGDEPDFLLTGFEWSMRLSSEGPKRKTASSVHSFYEDWRALGNLIAWILNIPSVSKPKEPYRADPSANTDFLFGPERDLLRMLIAADPLARLDADVVTEQLDRILPTLEQQRVGSEAKLVLTLRLDAQQEMSRAIRAASDQTIGLADYNSQRRFIADALADSPRLVKVKGRDGGPEGYKLTSPMITLELRPYALTRGGETTWSLAEGRRMLREKPAQAEIVAECPLDGWDIEVIDMGEARQRAPRLQGKTTRWDALIKAPADNPTTAALRNRSYAAAMLVQVTDMLWRAAQIWPVRRVSMETRGSVSILTLEGRDDPVLTALSQALGIQPPAARLLTAMRDETIEVDGEWQLSTDLATGRVRGRTSVWRFSELDDQSGRARYVFESSASPADIMIAGDLYLQLEGPGYDALVERRLNALKNLRDHSELLGMLEDPGGEIRLSRDDTKPIAGLEADLDASKAAALTGAWEQLPLYLVQGPPGVGKTRLVRALVASRLGTSPMDRLLLSAQSHAAIDHLLDEVKEALDDLPDEVMRQIFPLRCRPMDAEAKSVWDREVQAKRIAESLEGSPLAAAASPAIRRKIAALKRVYQNTPASGGPQVDVSRQLFDRSFESLLLRSANLVFASTNSADLARLIDERGQFDWSMIEEAGKATGVELLAPLMLSHRRLLIGDHQQLPAFEAKRLKDILAEPSKMRAALEAGRDVIAPLFRKLDVEDVLDWVSENLEERLCGEAISMLQLFETLIEPNVLKRTPNAQGRTLGRQLLEQHRMHPVLGALISETFYEGKIRTFPKAAERFHTEVPPVASADPVRLPDAPLVFVDLPYVQSTVGMKPPESRPRWTNRMEAAACVDVLSLLRAEPDFGPTLAVLSPYRRQVRLLRETADKNAGRLGNLDAFRAKTEDGFYGTVDSFQGNEADAVVVSLVRNNSRSGLAALGFLSDERRMNVLLSRAKWRLIVVGSVNFLRACLPEHDALPPGDPLAFLARMLRFIAPEDAEPREGVKVIGIDTLRGAAK